jgi:hypothetical protein
MNELVLQATLCVAAAAAGESAAVAGAHRGGGPADVVGVAGVTAVLLGCAWIGRAGAWRRALLGVVPKQPPWAHEICHVRREHVVVEIVCHAGLSVSLPFAIFSAWESGVVRRRRAKLKIANWRSRVVGDRWEGRRGSAATSKTRCL